MEAGEIEAAVRLSLLPGIGSVLTKRLLAHLGSMDAILSAKLPRLLEVDGVGKQTAKALQNSSEVKPRTDEIVARCEKRKIRILPVTSSAYPTRLKEIDDPPIVLFTAGDAPQEPTRIISIVGTRKSTSYGKRITQELVRDLTDTGATIVSGLAFGIDTYAHKASLEQKLPTFAVLATPLDKVYPAQNRELAIDIFKAGRLYSEYAPGSVVDARNFPARNRIIAGLSDATIVVEATESGGALITADLAQQYNRQVFAVPGRLGDEASAGCLKLIANSQAAVFTGVDAFLEELGWLDGHSVRSRRSKTELPAHLTEQEKVLMTALALPAGLHIDDLSFRAGLGLNALAGLLLKLEFEGLVTSLPGKKFRAADAFISG